jgi:hypothetical protein
VIYDKEFKTMDEKMFEELNKKVEEIVSLNVRELDVEELEKRLELSTVALDGGCLIYWTAI